MTSEREKKRWRQKKRPLSDNGIVMGANDDNDKMMPMYLLYKERFTHKTIKDLLSLLLKCIK